MEKISISISPEAANLAMRQRSSSSFFKSFSKSGKFSFFFLISLFIAAAIIIPVVLLSQSPTNFDKSILEHNQKDLSFTRILSADKSNSGSQGFADQMKGNTNKKLFRFFPQSNSDHYTISYQINGPTDQEFTANNNFKFTPNANAQPSINMDAQFIVYDSSSTDYVIFYAAFVKVKQTESITSLIHTYETDQNQGYQNAKAAGLILLRCKITRDDTILSCDKPDDLDAKLYLVLLKAIRLYAPNLDTTFYEVNDNSGNNLKKRANSHSEESKIGSKFEKKYTAKLTIANNGDVSQCQLTSSGKQTKFSSDNQMKGTSRNALTASTHNLDPTTGKVLSAEETGSFDLQEAEPGSLDTKTLNLLKIFHLDYQLTMTFVDSPALTSADLSFLTGLLNASPLTTMDDPLSSASSLINHPVPPSKADSKPRVLTGTPVMFTQTFPVFSFEFFGLSFNANAYITCYWNKYCHAGGNAQLGPVHIDFGEVTLFIGNWFKDLQGFLYMKTLVLDKVEDLDNALGNEYTHITSLVTNFVKDASTSIITLKTYLGDSYDELLTTLNSLKSNLIDLNGFGPNNFPVLDQEIKLMYHEIVGFIQIKMSQNFQIYYDFLQMYWQLVLGDITNYQHSLKQYSDAEKVAIETVITNILSNYDTIYNQIVAAFTQFLPSIQSWKTTIVAQIKSVLLSNNVFNSASPLFAQLANRVESTLSNFENTYLISETVKQLETSYLNDVNRLSGTYTDFKGYITGNLNNFRTVLYSQTQATNVLDPLQYQFVQANSLFVNTNAFNNLISTATFPTTPAGSSVTALRDQRIATFLGTFKAAYNTKFQEYKIIYISTFNTLRNDLSDLLATISDTISDEKSDIIDSMNTIFSLLVSKADLVMTWFNTLTDINFVPTQAQINAMMATNIFTLGDQINDLFSTLNSRISSLGAQLINLRTNANSLIGSRLLEENAKMDPRQLTTFTYSPNLFQSTLDLYTLDFGVLVPIDNDIHASFDACALFLGVSTADYATLHYADQLTRIVTNVNNYNVLIYDTIAQYVVSKFDPFFSAHAAPVASLQSTLLAMAHVSSRRLLQEMPRMLLTLLDIHFPIYAIDILDIAEVGLFGHIAVEVDFDWHFTYTPGTFALSPSGTFSTPTPWIFALVVEPSWDLVLGLEASIDVLGIGGGLGVDAHIFSGNIEATVSLEVTGTGSIVLLPLPPTVTATLALNLCLDIWIHVVPVSFDVYIHVDYLVGSTTWTEHLWSAPQIDHELYDDCVAFAFTF